MNQENNNIMNNMQTNTNPIPQGNSNIIQNNNQTPFTPLNVVNISQMPNNNANTAPQNTEGAPQVIPQVIPTQQDVIGSNPMNINTNNVQILPVVQNQLPNNETNINNVTTPIQVSTPQPVAEQNTIPQNNMQIPQNNIGTEQTVANNLNTLNTQNNQTELPPEPPIEKKKSSLPLILLICLLLVALGFAFYKFVLPNLTNSNNQKNNEVTEDETIDVPLRAWDLYSNLRTGSLGTNKSLNGGFRILSDTETYWVFKDNEFWFYKSINDLNDNYWNGTFEVQKGKAAATSIGIKEESIDTIINNSNGQVTEEDINILSLTPTKIISNGEDKSSTNIEEGTKWTYVWILVNHGEEGIEAQVLNVNQSSTSYYVKVTD